MHTLEPHFNWRHLYQAEKDQRSPFFGRTYSEFYFSERVYNYLLHPQWDNFGSETLYAKILYADYNESFAIIELIGEWNDCINDDMMHLKENLLDLMLEEGIRHYIFICENVLNCHTGDDDYYLSWHEELEDIGGWTAVLNVLPHVQEEMLNGGLQYYLHFGERMNHIDWRTLKPKHLFERVRSRLGLLLE